MNAINLRTTLQVRLARQPGTPQATHSYPCITQLFRRTNSHSHLVSSCAGRRGASPCLCPYRVPLSCSARTQHAIAPATSLQIRHFGLYCRLCCICTPPHCWVQAYGHRPRRTILCSGQYCSVNFCWRFWFPTQTCLELAAEVAGLADGCATLLLATECLTDLGGRLSWLSAFLVELASFLRWSRSFAS